MLGLDVRAGVTFDAEGFEEWLFWAHEAHGEEDELSRTDLLGTGDLLRAEDTLIVLLPFDFDSVDFLEVALFVGDELRGGGEVDARVGAELGGGLFLAVVDLVGLRPFRPGVILGAGERGLRHDLELDDGLAAVAERGAHTVGAGVAAADDDYILTLGSEGRIRGLAVQEVLRVGVEELHREVHALGVAAGEGEVATLGGTHGEDDGVKVLAELFR